MTAPEYRTQVKRWFVEIGVCDGGGIGHWVETTECVEVTGEAEANALRDEWMASGKLRRMPWGELRPQNPYGLFRIRQVWEDTLAPTDAAHVNEAPKSEHDAGNVLTDAAQAREAALREAAAVCAGIRQRIANGPMPEGARFDYEQAILAFLSEART